LVRDVHHPVALAFQSSAIEGDLEELAASLKIGHDPGLEVTIPEFTDSELLTLESEGNEGQAARKNLAAKLKALHVAGAKLSDRLSMRHFSHTGDSRSVWT
jgi:hypothetical protein